MTELTEWLAHEWKDWLTLLRIALDRGKLTVRDAVQLTGGNRNTIKRHLSQLVQRGALQQEGTGKGTWYRPA